MARFPTRLAAPLLLALALLRPESAVAAQRCVVLLHALGQGRISMSVMQDALLRRGYKVVNAGYPSRSAAVEDLARRTLPRAVAACGTPRADVVTHSLGGILLRVWLRDDPGAAARIGRVVMLAPPNQGSPLVDRYRTIPGFTELMGPAGMALGTGPGALPRRLPPVPVEVGVIAGNRTLVPWNSRRLPGPDDGAVSVAATRVAGMRDHIVIPASHSLIVVHPMAIAQTAAFLRHGRFDRSLRWRDLLRRGLGLPPRARPAPS